MITEINKTCEEMRKQIYSAQRESAPMLEEEMTLTAEKRSIETKLQLLSAFNQHFVVSEEDLTTLTSSTEPVDDRFFQILDRVKQVHRDCEILLGTEDQRLGLELMEQTSQSLNAAFKKLYNWTQRELRVMDLEDPHISTSIRRSLRLLAERPALFQNCFDIFAQAREDALLDGFHMALAESVASVSRAARPVNPIELQTHDLLRYVGDILAWVHSTAVSEREALEGLFLSDDDEFAKESQVGRESQPWSRVHLGKDGPVDDIPVFDRRKALNELVNRDLKGIGRVMKQRLEIAVQSHDDPLSVYKAMNLFKFYRDIFSKLVGTPSTLEDNIAELQISSFSHFERLLLDETSTVADEHIPEDLSAPTFLLHALDRFKSLATAGSDLPGPEVSRLLSAALVPYLDRCSEMAGAISDLMSQNTFQLNYLFSVDAALRPVLPPNHSFLTAAHKKVDELREELVDTQHSFLLQESGVEQLLNAIQGIGANGSASTALTSLPVFNAEALASSAAQLDDFLASALMDMLENMGRLTDKGMGQDIAREATARFCTDFERVEEAILRADEEIQNRSRRREEKGDREEQAPLLRDVYPRTTAEVRVLLS